MVALLVLYFCERTGITYEKGTFSIKWLQSEPGQTDAP